ncbi:MAG: hypothetical protein RQ715_07155 [Methylococcales bacterium]|nr:hypothetical protein [Methylococcales bacterium]
MMKKTMIAASVAAACTLGPVTSQAVNVSLDSTGQALLYPYYNVNNGNTTFVSVTNTTDQAKAVKVRFREGVGSEDVFDFTLYLSPEDVWVGSLFRDGNNVKLSTNNDTSCTVPQRSALEAAAFSSARIDSDYQAAAADRATVVANRLSEGHIEIIEMAELPPGAITTAVTHQNGVPADCSVPVTFTGGRLASGDRVGAILDQGSVTSANITQSFNNPTGGLYGQAAIFNIASGTYFPYNATALNQFSANPIWWPQNAQPFTGVVDVAAGGNALIAGGLDSLGRPIANYRTADNGTTVPAQAGTLNFDLPDLSTPTTAEVAAGARADQYTIDLAGVPAVKTGIFNANGSPNAKFDKRDAVSASLVANTLQTDYITSDTFGSDWLITFPTRYLHVSDVSAVAPFTRTETVQSGQACHDVGFDFWNREEAKNAVDPGVGVSPGLPAPAFTLCFEVNVLALNNTDSASEALDAIATKADVPLEFADGWAQIDLTNAGQHQLTSGDNVVFNGLPVIGFTAVIDTVTGTERGGVFPSRAKFDVVGQVNNGGNNNGGAFDATQFANLDDCLAGAGDDANNQGACIATGIVGGFGG